jgi:basic membrane lipoprotein Med (substrate-binding protein (PBP1-ABC) superfamily)
MLRPPPRSRLARISRALAALLALGLAACGGGERESSPDVFRVGLLTPGSIRDAGWNQGAYEGLLRIRAELSAEIGHQQATTPQEFEAGFRDLAARGFDLVFGHGFEFQDAAAAVGREYPDCVFITTSGNTIRPNVAPIVFELEQATYVLGYVGGKLSRSAVLAELGGMEIPSVASTFAAFEAGARASRPQASVLRSYIGSWEDVAAAKEATLAQVAQGADVLIHNADAAAAGFFQAVRERDVIAFGTNRDQNGLAPERVLASATLDIPQALLLVAREVKQGQFWARSIEYGLADGVVGIAWNEALLARLDPSVRSDAERIADKIRSGALKVPRGF